MRTEGEYQAEYRRALTIVTGNTLWGFMFAIFMGILAFIIWWEFRLHYAMAIIILAIIEVIIMSMTYIKAGIRIQKETARVDLK